MFVKLATDFWTFSRDDKPYYFYGSCIQFFGDQDIVLDFSTLDFWEDNSKFDTLLFCFQMFILL